MTARLYHEKLILYIRKDRHVARALDGCGQLTLMLGAVARNSSGKDLAPLRNLSLQLIYILVADLAFLATEYANFLSSAESTRFSSVSTFTAFAISLISHCQLSSLSSCLPEGGFSSIVSVCVTFSLIFPPPRRIFLLRLRSHCLS